MWLCTAARSLEGSLLVHVHNVGKQACSQAPEAPPAPSGGGVGGGGGGRGGENGPGLHQPARGGAVEGLLAAGAEVVQAAGAPARGPLGLGVVRRWRAAAAAAAQGLVLLQVAGGLTGRETQSSSNHWVPILVDDETTQLEHLNLLIMAERVSTEGLR